MGEVTDGDGWVGYASYDEARRAADAEIERELDRLRALGDDAARRLTDELGDAVPEGTRVVWVQDDLAP